MGWMLPQPVTDEEEQARDDWCWRTIGIGALFYLIIGIIMLIDIYMQSGLPPWLQ